jgi:RNA polymerase sigma-70 factor (ECF subfamily)
MSEPLPLPEVAAPEAILPPDEVASNEQTEDLVLVQRAQEGDIAAYDTLVQRYQERVYATIYHMTANHEDAGDLTQETFIKGYQALKTFKGDSSFYTWVYRIAVNKTINFLKQRKNKSHLSLNDLDFNAEHDPDFILLVSDKTPRRDANLTELQEKLNAAMLKLSPAPPSGRDLARRARAAA